MSVPNVENTVGTGHRAPRSHAALELERQAEAAERRSAARSWLVGVGLLEPIGAGDYALTPDGRDWLLWALWEAAGSPGVPAEAYDKEASP